MDQNVVYLPYLCLFKITVLFSIFLLTINWWLRNCNFQVVEILIWYFFGFEVTKMFGSIIVFTYIYINSEQTLTFWLGFATQSGQENTN